MLTAKVGKEIINCLDTKYDRYRLKQWSSKGILKCPVCNEKYEYCHGEVVPPYFRHVVKECNGYYSEQETDEHRSGKILLYEWIKNQEGVSEVNLEHWIPETKQRPDIYFEFNNEKCVIEFQCSPIASEFIIRRELYRLAGIHDIWILGIDKYNIEICSGEPNHMKRYKLIEKELLNNSLIYLDVKRKAIITDLNILDINKKLENSIAYFQLSNKKEFDLFSEYLSNKMSFVIESINNFIFDNGIKINNELNSMLSDIKDTYINNYDDIMKDRKRRHDNLLKFKDKYNNDEIVSTYVGEIGNDTTLNVLLMEKIYFKTYKSTLYKFVTEDGDLLTWLTSLRPNISVGDYAVLSGKVKAHLEYENIKQTRMVRCKTIKF
ncbi:hypothetical protein FJQ98_16615 [Lysinibacillus agricola]|uniref:Competence protein CoiA nuclease-like domain-containing protein n=1 Tax=Lysinibacillus agricola TaxID=2590012 RepID=A0ABX7AM01_9BACI|nr:MULTISPECIES: competence protein CoiA family protein [Lysinibacillus]KOS61449.1 hypothetical protein AN161_17820 [Lysinibacillus sp. FJAT-14222]QQP10869.1 hypothetical protein FJQ98_16615 [Lysinibacillus agricola]